MDKNRRDFLKIAGATTLAGIGGPTVVERLISGSSPAQARAGHGTESADHGSVTHAATSEHGGKDRPTGKRLGMVVDLRQLKKHPELMEKITRACHAEHNVPHFPNRKDEIKWIWATEFDKAFTEHSNYYKDTLTISNEVLVFCNHCDEPPCVKACPTRATFKTKDGIVAMDYHRCIGCRFCMAACPYGSRSFNWRDPRGGLDMNHINRHFPTRMRGVVEKCNFCAERVGLGKQPKCVEVCGSTRAMIFGDLNDPSSEIRKVLKENFTIQRKPSAGTHPSVFYIV